MEQASKMNQYFIQHLGNTKVGTWIGSGVGVVINWLFPEHGILGTSLVLQIIALVWPVFRTLVFAAIGGAGGYYGSLLAKNAHMYILEKRSKRRKKNEESE